MSDERVDDCYIKLANAVIVDAVKEYRRYICKYHKTKKKHKKDEYQEKIDYMEKYFRSGDFGILTGIDPEAMIAGVKEQCEKYNYNLPMIRYHVAKYTRTASDDV